MVGTTGAIGVTLLLLVGASTIFYAVIDRLLTPMFDVKIIDDEEEFIGMFKNGLRNSAWKDYEDREDNNSL